MVVGYRAPRRDPFMRLVNAKVWNVLNRALFGLKVRDIDCAFKLFRRDVVQPLTLRSNGAMINAEILIRLQRSGVDIKEVPVSHLPRTAGSPTGAKPSVIMRALREMVQLYQGDLGLSTQKQALKFMVVGLINTAIDLTAYVALTHGIFALPILPAKFLSFMIGTVSSLLLNRFWTFEMRTRISLAEIARFYATVSLSMGVNLLTLYAAVHVFGLNDLVGVLFATAASFSVSYGLSRLWVFRPQPLSLLPA
jgi:putative flippase GtrA